MYKKQPDREDLARLYEADESGIIRGEGIFKGQRIYVPYFLAIAGADDEGILVDSEGRANVSLVPNFEDRREFPELKDRKFVTLQFEAGIFCGELLDEKGKREEVMIAQLNHTPTAEDKYSMPCRKEEGGCGINLVLVPENPNMKRPGWKAKHENELTRQDQIHLTDARTKGIFPHLSTVRRERQKIEEWHKAQAEKTARATIDPQGEGTATAASSSGASAAAAAVQTPPLM